MTEEQMRQERDAQRLIRHVVRQCRHEKVQMIRFLYCGNDGVIRGKTTHIDHLAHRLTEGIGLTVAMQSFTMLDQLVPEGHFGPVGKIRLLPDPASLSEDERHQHNIQRLPHTLTEALDALQADAVLMTALGTELAQEYLIVKCAEAAAFRDKDEMFELAHHFYVY